MCPDWAESRFSKDILPEISYLCGREDVRCLPVGRQGKWKMWGKDTRLFFKIECRLRSEAWR